MSLISIPSTDPSWLRLPDHVRRDARKWEAALNRIHAADNRQQAMRAAIGSLGRRCTRKTIETRYYRAKRHGWSACVDWSKVPNKSILPALFVDHFIALSEKNQRGNSMLRAHNRLKEQYRRWHSGDPTAAIPGYKECPKPNGKGIPHGWDYTNLIRIARGRRSAAESLLAKQGIAAARARLPHVPQDVSEVRPLEFVIFDDVEVDFLIAVSGSTAPVKLRLLVAMDLCSRCILGFGARPAIVRPDGVEDSLKLRDMKCIVARTLSKWGFPIDYAMTLIVERATATLKEGDISALNEISNGQIHVSLTSMICGSVFEFADRSSGNSWGKAWLESFFNYLHNELGDREGQKGRRYDLAPAELHGRTRELATLMRAGQRMPLALRRQLCVPFMDGETALQEIGIAFAKANARTDHACQGFDKTQTWRLDPNDQWKPAESLPLLADQLQIDVSVLAQRAQWDSRIESPNERLARKLVEVGRQEVSRAALHLLMDEHRRVKFEDFQFNFDWQGKEHIYLPPERMLPLLEHGKSYLAWFDPQDLEVVYLTRDFPHRGWVGELKLFRRTRRGEIEEKKEALRQVKHTLNYAAAQVASRQPEKFDNAIARAEQNIEVLRNVTALEVERDVVDPTVEAAVSAADSPAVREMAARIRERVQASEEARLEAKSDKTRVRSIDDFLTAPPPQPNETTADE